MKKAVRLVLSLFSALSLMFLSCSTDSSGGGGSSSEFDVALQETEFVYNNESIVLKVTSKSNFDDLYFAALDVYDGETLIGEDVKFDPVKNIKRERWDITVSGVYTTPGTNYTYKLYVSKSENTPLKNCVVLEFTVKVSGTYVEKPVITEQPKSATYNKGDTAKALVVKTSLDGTVSLKYQWFKNGEKIDGATENSYIPEDTGSYYVIVYNGTESAESDKAEIIFENPNAKTPVFDSEIKDNEVADIKNQGKLVVKAHVEEGTIHAQWYKDNKKIGDEATGEKTIETSYQPDSFGEYKCVLWNVNGDEKSGEISSIAKISESEIEIDITGKPENSNDIVLGTELSVEVTSNVPCDYTYQWWKDNASSSNPEVLTGKTEKTYTPDVAGTYYCKVIATSKATGNKTKETLSNRFYVVKGDSGTGNAGINVDFGSN